MTTTPLKVLKQLQDMGDKEKVRLGQRVIFKEKKSGDIDLQKIDRILIDELKLISEEGEPIT